MKKVLNEELLSTHEIISLGRVNQVFEIKGASGEYIAPLNTAPEKRIEYRKIESEIHLPKLLHHLGKYRWAEDYEQAVRNTLVMIG